MQHDVAQRSQRQGRCEKLGLGHIVLVIRSEKYLKGVDYGKRNLNQDG